MRNDREDTFIIRAEELFDGKGRQLNKAIVVKGERIIDVTANTRITPNIKGFVTPAFIDAHSHIGMCRQGEPSQEKEVNDFSKQISPLNDPLNSIYFDDRAFSDAVDFGVLYGCVVPGSHSIIGGKAKIIRYYAQNRGDGVLFKDYGYKMALGFNPRDGAVHKKGEWPDTRMGNCVLLEKAFDETRRKKQRAEVSAFSLADTAILEILSGKKTVKVHVHKEDDIFYLIELTRRYNLKATAEHCGDVFRKEVFDALARENIPVVYGPLGSLSYKVELKHDHYANVRFLMQSEAFYGLMTDHPVIDTTALRDSLKFFLIQGMKEEEAISLITYKNAKILGIDDELGAIEAGKLASLVVWDRNPLHLGAFPILVMAEGKILRRK